MESEALQQAPQMHAEVSQMQADVAQIKMQSEQVCEKLFPCSFYFQYQNNGFYKSK